MLFRSDRNQYVLTEDASETLKSYLSATDIAQIGNGRGARNLFEKAVTQQAKRIERMPDANADLQEIIAEDIEKAIRRS